MNLYNTYDLVRNIEHVLLDADLDSLYFAISHTSCTAHVFAQSTTDLAWAVASFYWDERAETPDNVKHHINRFTNQVNAIGGYQAVAHSIIGGRS